MPPPLVLFVCVENSCRSQMAEGFARSFSDDRARVYSAGSRPSGEVDPRAVRLMAEKGVDLAGQRSTGLAELPEGATWDYVVTMGCRDACPQLAAARRLDWDLPDPKPLGDDGFRQVRDEIERRVRSLLSASVEGPGERGRPRSGASD
jgi:protein-tyrosine-phosphatase